MEQTENQKDTHHDVSFHQNHQAHLLQKVR